MKILNAMSLIFVFLAGFTICLVVAQSSVDNLPESITMIIGFGDRLDWSHDGKKVIFVGKQLGDVYEYDVEAKFIKCLISLPAFSIKGMQQNQ